MKGGGLLSSKDNLMQIVLINSESQNWIDAIGEWDIVDVWEDQDCKSTCVCGQKHIKYLYKIENTENNNVLYPVGSSCIKRFGRYDFDEKIGLIESMYKLLYAVERGEFIKLTSKYFSKKLLQHLFDRGIFKPNKYNNWDGSNDFKFLSDMFNIRGSIPENKLKKVRGLIFYVIIPYVKSISKRKVE